jgi:hypothetical protein
MLARAEPLRSVFKAPSRESVVLLRVAVCGSYIARSAVKFGVALV